MSAPRALPDARWSCRSCGTCCHGYDLGPVEPEVIAGLTDAGIEALWPPAAEGWMEHRPGPDGEPAVYLAYRGDGCVFLQDDQRCAVHRLLGPEAKPWFCRAYPFHAVRDPLDGRLSVVVRADCGGLASSSVDGPLVTDQLDEVLALPRPVPWPELDGGGVDLVAGARVSAERWREVETELLAHLVVPRQPEDTVVTTRARLLRAAGHAPTSPDPAACRIALDTVLAALEREAPHPLLAAATRSSASPALAEDAQRYLGQILRSELLIGEAAQLGSVAALLGLFLLKATVARRTAPGTGPLTAADLGAVVPSLERALQDPERWPVLQDERAALETVCLTAG